MANETRSCFDGAPGQAGRGACRAGTQRCVVTPTTAELLLWWFAEDMVAARNGLNFHAG